MSNKGLYNDNTPFIRSAGITTAIEGDRTDVCIRPQLYHEVISANKASRNTSRYKKI